MSDQIPQWNVRDYKTNVELLLQTRGSMLRNFVTSDTYVGEGGRPVNQLGAVTAQKRTTRHGDTPLIPTPHSARWVEPSDYEWADLIDDQDKLRLLVDPQGPYAQNGALSLGRAIDSELVNAFHAASKIGPQGTDTAETFDLTNFRIVDGGVGLTVSKLRTAKRMLMGAKVDVRNDPLYIALTAIQHENLLSETQAISLDYNTTPVLVEGLIMKFMGFNFVHLEELNATGTIRELPCWARSGMHLGLWNDITTRISERDDKSYATQVYVKGTFGATRLEQGRVVQVDCEEA